MRTQRESGHLQAKGERPQKKLTLPTPDLGFRVSRIVKKYISVISVTQPMVFCMAALLANVVSKLCALIFQAQNRDY